MSEKETSAGGEVSGAIQQQQAAVSALAAVRAAAVPPVMGGRSWARHRGRSASMQSIEDSGDAMEGEGEGEATATAAEDPETGRTQRSLPGQRHSGGSQSTLDPSDWRGSGDHQLQGVYNSSMSPPNQAQLGVGAALLSSGDASRGRRNPRQQEQNKQAQQRYRAKRKAQFEELQLKVQLLSDEAMEAQHFRLENELLRGELAKLTTLLQAAAGTPAAATAAAAGAGLACAGGDLLTGHPSTSASQEPGSKPEEQQNGRASPPQQQQQRQQQYPHLGRFAEQGSGSGSPSKLAATTAAHPPAAAAKSPSLPLQLGAGQIQAALNLYYQDLQAFAASVQLEALPADGTGLSAEAAQKLTQLVHAGIELVRMVLQTSGPDAASLLTAGMAALGPDGTSPADSLKQWQVVMVRVALTPNQCLLLADWRRRFLLKIDDCYGRRLLHKAQLAQLPGAALGGQQQFVEALLLQAAESVGYSACALACAQLDGVVVALGDNLREERSTACTMMAELLDKILTKVQAARFLLSSHPFAWNGLSFAHAVAAMQQQDVAPVPAVAAALSAQAQHQEQQALLAQLLARHR